jgi:Skp family chaperone for outer membrane proteins
MKTRNLLFGLSIIALSFTGCKSEEEKNAEKTVDTYTVYVDSVGNVAAADAKANWEAIEAEYNQRTSDAEAALANMKDNEKAQERINASKAKYEELKAKYQAELDADMAAAPSGDYKAKLRSSLFAGSNMGDDLNFDWVNKDNILKVYNDFNNAYDANHDNYTREDFDEIKAMYEALDARKNTVEKEGLSSGDNLKIAELKLKFGPKFKSDRMGAKGAENQEAKDEAK